jgi:hypothetical protein
MKTVGKKRVVNTGEIEREREGLSEKVRAVIIKDLLLEAVGKS